MLQIRNVRFCDAAAPVCLARMQGAPNLIHPESFIKELKLGFKMLIMTFCYLKFIPPIITFF